MINYYDQGQVVQKGTKRLVNHILMMNDNQDKIISCYILILTSEIL